METRKVQSVGGGTYTVSLPKEWAESEGIAAGDSVNLHSHIDGLLVAQVREREEDAARRVPVRVPEDGPETLARTLRAAYAVGVKEVTLDASAAFTTDQRRAVDRVARCLPGVSVAEESETEMTVRTLLDADELSVRKSVRQLEFLTLSMHRDATATLTADATPENRVVRGDQTGRLHALIDRSLARGLERLDEVDALGATRSELFDLWATSRELQRVADHAEAIATVAARTDDGLTDATAGEVRELARGARRTVSDSVNVVLGEADVETAQRASRTRDRLREAITDLDRRSAGSDEAPQIGLVLDRVRRTAEHGGHIAEVGIRSAIRRGDLTEFHRDPDGEADRSRDTVTGG